MNMRRLCKYMLLCVAAANPLFVLAFTSQNYVTTRLYLDPTGNEANSRVSTTFYDGLGRERQRVDFAAGGNGENIVWQTDYDSRGNVGKKWLPVPSGASFLPLKSFTSAAKEMYGEKEIAYTSFEYEYNGLNRQNGENGPGIIWKSHGKSLNWHSNESKGNYSCIMLVAHKDGSVMAKGMYPPKSLAVTETVSPDNIRVLQFENRAGKVVMERRIGSDGVVADTRFIYDARGDLRCALSPEGSKLIQANCKVDNSVLDDYGQRFEYDIWHRCISAKAPGCGAVQYVYNSMDAVCFESTALQRASGIWTVTKYDSRRRPAVKGLATIPGATRESLQSQYGDSPMQERYLPESRYLESALLYSNDCGPSGFKPYMAWYYDNYDFMVSGNEEIKQKLESALDGAYTQKDNCTGMALCPNNTSNVWYAASKYDHRGQLVSHYLWDLFLRSYRHSIENTYDFAGNLTQTDETLAEMAEATVLRAHTAQTRFEYDGYGRPVRSTLRIDGNPEIVISENSYDAVGRLSFEKGMVTTSYTYDIRSNLTGIDSDYFSQKAWFGSSPDKNAAINYSGINALTSSWFDGQDFSGVYSKPEIFSYDGLGRYKSSISENGDISEEIVTDLDANVIEIKRMFNGDVVQDAVLQYDGGKNTAVSDCSTPYWADKVGRFPSGDYEIKYDIDGRIISDDTRGIKSVTYQVFDNLPSKLTMENGDYTTNEYFPDGNLLKRIHSTRVIKTSIKVTANGDTIIKTIPVNNAVSKYYFGNFERIGNSYTYITPQGHYDLAEKTHYWYQRDRLGSTVAVYDEDGKIVQTAAYYPSGTPHQLPAAGIATDIDAVTDRLHIGNHWLGHSGMNLYDNTARLHDPLLMHYGAPDPLFVSYPSISPWSHCGSDPLNHVDFSGKDICILLSPKGSILDTSHTAMLIQDKNGKWLYYSFNGSNKKYSRSSTSTSGLPYNDVAVGGWDTPQEFLNSSYNMRGDNYPDINGYGYDKGYVIKTSSEQDQAMHDKFTKQAKTKYHLLFNNCVETVNDVMGAGGFKADKYMLIDPQYGSLVNEQNLFEMILPTKFFKFITRYYDGDLILKDENDLNTQTTNPKNHE